MPAEPPKESPARKRMREAAEAARHELLVKKEWSQEDLTIEEKNFIQNYKNPNV